MGTLKINRITGRSGSVNNSPITLDGDTATLGSGVNGFAGIKTVDVYQLNTSVDGSQNPIQAQHFTRGTSSTGGANLGTGVTLNGSGTDAGIFTFPSTGIWRVEASAGFQLNGSSRYIFLEIFESTTGTGGTFTGKSIGRTYINRTDSNTTHTSVYTTCILDVTTSGTSGTAIRFEISVANSGASAQIGNMATYFIFTRLGDTSG